MTEQTEQKSIARRVLEFPLTRLILMMAPLFALIATNGNIMLKFKEAPLIALVLVAVMDAVALAIYFYFVRFVERRTVAELEIAPLPRELAIGGLIGAGLYTACVLILMVLGIYRIDDINPLSYMLPAMAMALSSGVLEELIFRGVLFRIVEESLGSWISLLISSFVFGFLHLVNPQGTVMGALFISIEAGVLLGAAYMLTRRLWVSIGFHIAWNYTQSGIFSGIVSGGDADPGLIKATIDGPKYLTGGSFGLESSLVAFCLCTTTGVIMLVLAVRGGKIIPPFWKRHN
jgi:membrane protease YdiL (CAAX protease family)